MHASFLLFSVVKCNRIAFVRWYMCQMMRMILLIEMIKIRMYATMIILFEMMRDAVFLYALKYSSSYVIIMHLISTIFLVR